MASNKIGNYTRTVKVPLQKQQQSLRITRQSPKRESKNNKVSINHLQKETSIYISCWTTSRDDETVLQSKNKIE